MFNYPVILNLANVSCLVAGAGTVGVRKALRTLEAGAKRVVMVAPSLPARSESPLEKFSAFKREVREFNEDDLSGVTLVFAATNNPDLNRDIAAQCALKGILCNNASSPENGSFSVPAALRSTGLNIAVGAGSAGPALARLICDDLAKTASVRYEEAVEFMSCIRPKIIALNLPDEPKRRLLTGLAELSISFNEPDFLSLQPLLEEYLPGELADEIATRLILLKAGQA